MNSLFLGFIIASIPLIVKLERNILSNNKKNIIFLIMGIIILLIFGLYSLIINAIKQVLRLNLNYLLAIIIFGVGGLVGVLVTMRTVRYLLRKFRASTIYFIIGLMVESIYAVIMGTTSLEISRPQMNASTFNVAFFLIGVIH